MKKTPQDPHGKREAARYENPIASRELILSQFQAAGRPLHEEQLRKLLGIEDDTGREALRRRLGAMVRDGQLVRTRRGTLGLPEKMDLEKGVIIGHRDGFGFVACDEGGEDVFVSPGEMRKVMDSDRVLFQRVEGGRRGRPEARIVEVLERGHRELVGRFQREDGYCFVVPDNPRICHEILVSEGLGLGPEPGQLVAIELTQYPGNRLHAAGRITEVLGDALDAGMEIEVAIRNFGIPCSWPEAVLQQAQSLPEEVTEAACAGRVDLRDLPLVTIDGEDARDFDDAVYASPRKEGGYRLVVAIADVSAYVPPGTPLDEEARLRGNSVYFPGRVVPMLPEALSNGLCSLNPRVDRLCMVCDLQIGAEGSVESYQFYEAVMCSHARLTYTQVAALLLEPESPLAEETRARIEGLEANLWDLYGLYLLLRKQREIRGAMDFDTVETRIDFTEDRKIKALVPVVRNEAHKLIEECMLCANVAAADFLQKQQVPALYRVHAGPTEEKIQTLQENLSLLGVRLFASKRKQLTDIQPSDFQFVLSQIADRPDAAMIQSMLLRSMSQAVYSAENIGHFGLAYEAYAHFTSPIRRYPDLLVHRAIKSRLRKEGAYPYTMAQIVEAGEHCSMTERRADDATRDVVAFLKCEYMQQHLGETLEGVITGVTGFGFFVQSLELYVEGLVHISSLDDDYYHFDESRQRLVGERSGTEFRLGDELAVTVAGVNLDERKIDFVLASSSGKGRSGRKKKTVSTTRQAPKESSSKKKTGSSSKKTSRSQGKKRQQAALRKATKGRKSRPRK